jgi:hypothetical protein
MLVSPKYMEAALTSKLKWRTGAVLDLLKIGLEHCDCSCKTPIIAH